MPGRPNSPCLFCGTVPNPLPDVGLTRSLTLWMKALSDPLAPCLAQSHRADEAHGGHTRAGSHPACGSPTAHTCVAVMPERRGGEGRSSVLKLTAGPLLPKAPLPRQAGGTPRPTLTALPLDPTPGWAMGGVKLCASHTLQQMVSPKLCLEGAAAGTWLPGHHGGLLPGCSARQL